MHEHVTKKAPREHFYTNLRAWHSPGGLGNELRRETPVMLGRRAGDFAVAVAMSSGRPAKAEQERRNQRYNPREHEEADSSAGGQMPPRPPRPPGGGLPREPSSHPDDEGDNGRRQNRGRGRRQPQQSGGREIDLSGLKGKRFGSLSELATALGVESPHVAVTDPRRVREAFERKSPLNKLRLSLMGRGDSETRRWQRSLALAEALRMDETTREGLGIKLEAIGEYVDGTLVEHPEDIDAVRLRATFPRKDQPGKIQMVEMLDDILHEYEGVTRADIITVAPCQETPVERANRIRMNIKHTDNLIARQKQVAFARGGDVHGVPLTRLAQTRLSTREMDILNGRKEALVVRYIRTMLEIEAANPGLIPQFLVNWDFPDTLHAQLTMYVPHNRAVLEQAVNPEAPEVLEDSDISFSTVVRIADGPCAALLRSIPDINDRAR